MFRLCSVSSEKMTEASHQRSSSSWQFAALITNVCPSQGYPVRQLHHLRGHLRDPAPDHRPRHHRPGCPVTTTVTVRLLPSGTDTAGSAARSRDWTCGNAAVIALVPARGWRRPLRTIAAGTHQVKPTSRTKCPSLRSSVPPPAQCTMYASRMMARITTTNQKKNTTMPGIAYPATLLALATGANYPPPPGLFHGGAYGPADRPVGMGHAGQVDVEESLPGVRGSARDRVDKPAHGGDQGDDVVRGDAGVHRSG